jgi:hypothetical protein
MKSVPTVDDKSSWLDALITRVTEANGGPLSDDLALVMLCADGGE